MYSNLTVFYIHRIHVRRTDKIGSEAAFHSVDEYMTHVNDYYDQLEVSRKIKKRRVYVASDDPGVIEEIKLRLVWMPHRCCQMCHGINIKVDIKVWKGCK